MKILFIARPSFYSNSGGDTVQVLNTIKYLKLSGIEAEIKLSHERFDYSGYDLLHFFNIIRPADILVHIRRSGKPYVVSTIYVDYSEFEKAARSGLAGWVFRRLNPGFIEYVKSLARWILGKEPLVSREFIVNGYRKSIRKIIKKSSLLLPNSQSEYQRLVKDLGIEHPYSVIPNAIDPHLFRMGKGEIIKKNDLVLCAGRIEGLKNQLNLIKALNGTGFNLLIIGRPATNQQAYYRLCRESAGPNVSFIDFLPQEELAAHYRRAKVHVMPSWFETTGLSSLEAAAMGCNIVITGKGDAKEYFGEEAFYCDPSSVESIREAVEHASISPVDSKLQQKILEKYTWEIAAQKTLDAYRMVLSEKE